MFPIPGSQVAPPGAQIAFRGIGPLALASVKVSGSVSGTHAGRIEGDSDGDGGSFVPSTPFTPGEVVTVTTSLNLVGAPSGAYQFRVASGPGPIPYAPAQVVAQVPGDVLRFHSRPDLTPAALRILHGSGLPGQDLFLAPQFGPLQDGPMIVDAQGRLVFFQPMPAGHVASDVRVQSYQGRPVLTWWQGFTNAGVGEGMDEIYDGSYQPVATVSAADGLSADLHEFLLTPQGTALVVSYYPVWWDTRSVGGSAHKIVLDSVVQEIDIPTGLELFQWDSLDHVPLSDSYVKPAPKALYDYFHVNSVDVDFDGNLIISGRNTWAAYKVDHSSAATIWTLGGKHSTFRLGTDASFAFQHDVTVPSSGDRRISLFDDGGGPPQVHASRAITLALDLSHRTARLVVQRSHTPSLSSRFQGNAQTLPEGNLLVGWGQQPYITLFGARGRVLLDARFVAPTSSYRAYTYPWTGTHRPPRPPCSDRAPVATPSSTPAGMARL